MSQPIHIVTRFDGTGGTEHHASELHRLLCASGHLTKLWADRPGSVVARFGATPINSFGGQLPRGGTLIILGTHLDPGIWLDHVRPNRLIVICNLFALARTFAFLAILERPSLPTPQLVFVSRLLQQALALPGIIAPPLIDLDRFHPARRSPFSKFRIGRHSRDEQSKHHPDDVSLWCMLAWHGYQLRLMGASHVRESLAEMPNVDILDVGQEEAPDFVANLDCFFYRTSPEAPEASGRCVIEAMAAGVPVIASPNGGYVEWIDSGKNGYLVNCQEDAFERIVALGDNSSLQRKMSLAARCTAERFSGAATISPYLDWLSST